MGGGQPVGHIVGEGLRLGAAGVVVLDLGVVAVRVVGVFKTTRRLA